MTKTRNVVFIPNIDLKNGRSDSYVYSIRSWYNWCDKNDVQLVEWKDPIFDVNVMKITLQRYWVHDMLQKNEIEYDQVLMVDADTVIHPEAPNFFEETQGKFSVVLNNGCYEWVTRSIEAWGNSLFPNEAKIKTWRYFNGGFQITNKSHIEFYNYVKEYYVSTIDQINKLNGLIRAGTDQTIINYLAQKFEVDINYLPECYNLQDLFRKNLLHIPGHSYTADELLFVKAGWVYHFNAIPANDRNTSYWLKRTYEELTQK